MNNIPKILLINNIPTHHQMPLAEELHKLCGDSFRIAFIYPITVDRKLTGWEDIGNGIPWVIRVWESKENQREFNKWLSNCDVIISYPFSFSEITQCLSTGKLCLLASERIWKPSNPFFLSRNKLLHQNPKESLRFYYRHLIYFTNYQKINKANCHLLAIGEYTAWDFSRIKVFHKRMWTYGYFVDVPKLQPIARKYSPINILYVGRFLKCKAIDILIKATARLLKENRGRFTLSLIGDGPERNNLETLAFSLGFDKSEIMFFGTKSPDEVRLAMKEAHILVLPSTYEEGWGAVVNEAMAEGCLVIVSEGVGSASLLINNGITGFTFPVGDDIALSQILHQLIDYPEQISVIGIRAWKYILNNWSPEIAAQRIIDLINGLTGNYQIPDYTDGPCSKALIIRPK